MYLHNKVPQPPLLTYKQSVLNLTKQKLGATLATPNNKVQTLSKLRDTTKKHKSIMKKIPTEENNSKENTTQKEKITWEEFLSPPELNPEQQILQGNNILPPGFDAFLSQLSTQKSLGRKTTLSDFPVIPTVFNGVNLSIGTYNSIVSTGSVFPTALLPLAPPHAPSVQWIDHNEITKDWLSCQPSSLPTKPLLQITSKTKRTSS